MKKLLLGIVSLWLVAASPALAVNVNIDGLPAATSAAGTDLHECEQAGTNNQCTMVQMAAYFYGLASSDLTCTGTGVCTLKNTGPGATGPLGSATVAPIVTIDAKGRVIALSSATIAPPFSAVTGRNTLAQLPQGIANSIWINPTGSTADMQNVAIPACANDGIHGLVYVNGTGLACASLTTGGGGTVTSVSAGCGTSTGGSAITTTGTVTAALTARTNTATSGVGADFVSTDCGGIVYDNSASSIAVSLPVATTSGFGANTFFARCNINAGVSTITPVTSTIGGAATLVVGAGTAAKPTCVYFRSDGTNYFLTETPFGTAATQNTGTSGGTLPFLNGTNTWSGTQTFGSVFGTVTTQSGTTYTLASTDCGTEIAFTNAAAITVTIPTALTTGCNIAILQTTSAGQVTVTGTAVSAATLHSAHSYTKTFGQWAIIGINIYTTGVAILTGDGA